MKDTIVLYDIVMMIILPGREGDYVSDERARCASI